MDEWASICDDDYGGLSFASIVTEQNRPYWILSMILLAFSLTSDCSDHLMYIRSVKWPWKILLMFQVIISMVVCVVNALLCAGSDSVLDILMNALGLMILNDLDNIVGSLFIFIVGIADEEEVDLFNQKDRIYALSFTYPHLTWVLFYCLWVLGVYQLQHPPDMYWFVVCF